MMRPFNSLRLFNILT